MTIFHSIRWRLQAWHGLLLVGVLGGFGWTAWRLERATRLERVDQDLEQHLSVIAGALPRPRGGPPEDRGGPGRPPFDRPPPEDFGPPERELRLRDRDQAMFEGSPKDAAYFVVWHRDGFRGPHSTNAPPDLPRPVRSAAARETRQRGTLRERIHFTPPGEIMLVGRDIGAELSEIQRFAWLLAGAAGVVLSLGLTGGWWISTRSLRPIGEISAAAGQIAAGDLARRIETADTSSELGDLARVLNGTFARLEASFARQAEFTADAAHELRTPVAVILMHVQNALSAPCANDEHREALEAIERGGRRLRTLIESLMVLARIDSGEGAGARQPCDLAGIAGEVVASLQPLARERGVTLETSLEAAPCLGDASQLERVVTNLAGNAIHYNRPGGGVRVATGPGAAPDQIALTVTDTGIGIAAEELPRIFERFYRADQARTHAAGHTGLGLAITKAVVVAHHGTVTAASTPGSGSTFTVLLPRRGDPA